MKNKSWVFTVGLFVLFTQVCIGGTIYVDANASGANNGSSWTDAYIYLQDALGSATSGDDLWVAQGTYKPDQGVGITAGDRNATFELKNGVAVYGGFPVGGDVFGGRDPDVYESVLNGDLADNDNDNISYDEPTRTENSYHVVSSAETNHTAILDGFVITGGNANGSEIPYYWGGGIYNENEPTPDWDCTTEGPTIINCNIIRNSSMGEGGGMYNRYSCSPIIKECIFENNASSWGGGAIKNDTSHPIVSDSIFLKNNVTSDGGAIDNEEASPKITNCHFYGNKASNKGGALVNWMTNNNPIFTNCIFVGNTAVTGGVVDVHNYWEPASSINFINCIFADNQAINGDVLSCSNDRFSSTVSFSNCIIWNGNTPIWNDDNSTINVTYCDIQDGWTGTGNININPLFINSPSSGIDGVWGTVDDDYGDLRLLKTSSCIDAGDNTAVPQDTEDIDNDLNTTEPLPWDLDKNPRFYDAPLTADTGIGTAPIIDMGAYEFGIAVIYVDDIADPLEDGSLSHPFDEIQEAIDTAIDGDTVIVLAGTYYENVDVNDLDITLTSFDPNDPNVVASTIIDANSLGRCITITDSNSIIAGFTITNGLADDGGGLHCVNSNLEINNCSISNNRTSNGVDYADDETMKGGNGGGLFSSMSTITLIGCEIKNNQTGDGGSNNTMQQAYPFAGGDGGGIYSSTSAITLHDCEINNNITGMGGDDETHLIGAGPGGDGGGICVINSDLELYDSYIVSNVTGQAAGYGIYFQNSGRGGGINTMNSNLFMSKTVVSSNRTGDGNFSGWSDENGPSGDGGGLFLNGSDAEIYDSIIQDNSTGDTPDSFIYGNGSGSGGGIWSNANLIIENTIINNNHTGDVGSAEDLGWGPSGSGGGIYHSGGQLLLFNSEIANNFTGNGGDGMTVYDILPLAGNAGDGGGIYSASLMMTQSLCYGNRTGNGGDLINSTMIYYPAGNGGDGGGIFCSSGEIKNCTISNNLTGQGGVDLALGDDGQDGEGSEVYTAIDTAITNTIIWNNTPGSIVGYDCNNISYSNISDGICSGSNGNISVDPLFLDSSNGNFHLLPISPCIDAGDPSSDYANEPQPNGGRINMGAYGNTSEAAITVDSDGDGITDPQETRWGLDWNDADSDDDGLTDYEEVSYDGDPNTYDPYDPVTETGTDLNAMVLDTDGDGQADLQEIIHGANPIDQTSLADVMTIYVDDVADPLEDGSLAHPFDEIQEAIDIAIDSDTIIVMEGIYYENVDVNDLDITLTSFDPNDPNGVDATIIDGQQLGSVITVTDSNPIIAGFTITNGLAEQGGGIYNSNSNPTVKNCIFSENDSEGFYAYGAGMYNDYSNPQIISCTFSDNLVSGLDGAYGGGMSNYNSSPIVTNCTFSDNRVVCGVFCYGGGMDNFGGSPIVTDCVFNDNALHAGDGHGGGMSNTNSNVVVINCIFNRNYADGGYYGNGGGIYNANGNPIISDCRFNSNITASFGMGGNGGGMYGGSAQNCVFIGNTASSYEPYSDSGNGGGMYGGSAQNCVFIGNTASCSSEPYSDSGNGGGMFGGGASNSTFWGNSSLNGGGVYNSIVSNCVLWDNTAPLNPQISSTTIPEYSCIESWTGGGIENINSDPLFIDPNNGDFHLKSEYGRWDPNQSLWVYDAMTSPCIDAGDPADSNWMEELWPHGKRINMGAYGGTPQASMSSSMVGNIADLNHNDCVGLEDFILFIEQWLTDQVLCPEDMDLDGNIDLADFSMFAANWSFCIGHDLIGWWQFDETAGSNANDSSTYGNHGTLMNGPVWTGNGELEFDGLDDYVEVPDSGSLDIQDALTISIWLYMDQYSTNWPKLVIKPYEDPLLDPWELYTLDLGHYGQYPRFILTDGVPGGLRVAAYDAGITLSLSQWHHVVGTYDGSTISLYVDGELVNSNPASIVIGSNDMPLGIGSGMGNYGFNGLINEVRIYDRALTETEIINLYQSH